jgi:crotonobetainyl-CoA:carnitine CoA-transferase CaiB-like acyl-CoA transferase
LPARCVGPAPDASLRGARRAGLLEAIRRGAPEPTKAPTIGERSHEVLGKLLGYDAQRIAKLKASGVFGGVSPGEP